MKITRRALALGVGLGALALLGTAANAGPFSISGSLSRAHSRTSSQFSGLRPSTKPVASVSGGKLRVPSTTMAGRGVHGSGFDASYGRYYKSPPSTRTFKSSLSNTRTSKFAKARTDISRRIKSPVHLRGPQSVARSSSIRTYSKR